MKRETDGERGKGRLFGELSKCRKVGFLQELEGDRGENTGVMRDRRDCGRN